MARAYERTAENDAAMVAAYRAGTAVKAIAEQFGCRYNAVKAILEENEIALPSHGNRRFTDEQEADMVRRFLAGESAAHIAEDYKSHRHTVEKIAARHGARRPPTVDNRKRLDDHDDVELIAELAARGWTQREIATRLGVNVSTIHHKMVKHGLKTLRMMDMRREGEHGPNWKGGRIDKGHGYMAVWIDPAHPFADSMRDHSGYVLEHRLIMAEHLGRPLHSYETVHHINGNVSDNRIENLSLRIGSHARGQAYQCADCGSFNVIPVDLKGGVTKKGG